MAEMLLLMAVQVVPFNLVAACVMMKSLQLRMSMVLP